MAKTKISEFSTTPGNNTDINGINIAEGCAPSGINNAIRELMSDLKEWQSGAMDVYVIPQGTAAAPGIQLYGDLDTGLYGYAANQLGVAVGGASAGYFSSAGWVGNVNGTITGDINATTIDTTNLEVTNIKAKDGTAAITIADSTGVVSVSTQLAVDNLNLSGNTLSSSDTNGNIVLAPNGTGDVHVDADTLRVGDSNANAIITTNGTGDLTLNTNGGTNSGAITIEDGVNGNINVVPNGTGGVYLDNTAGTSLFVRNTTSSASGSSFAAFQNKDGAGNYRTVARASGLTTSNGGNGSFVVETAFSNVLYKGLLINSESDVFFYDSNGNQALKWDSSDKYLGINQTSPTAALDVVGDVKVSGTVNAATIDLTNIEVTNIKAKDGSASATIADSTGVMTIASSVLTTTDINGGTIDGTTIGGSTAAAGTFTTATATTGNITTVNATTVDTTNIEVTNIKAKDGTAALSIADSTGVVSVSANPVLSGGTANGVVYLDASKVATSGSALTFDGTKLGVGVASAQAGVDIANSGSWSSGNIYNYPAGNAFVKIQGVAAQSNWIGIVGSYGQTTGSANLLLQANFNNTTQQAGHYIGSEAQSATSSDLTFGSITGGVTTGTNATKNELMRLTSTGLGIGTSSPGQRLTVVGNGQFSAASGNNYVVVTSGSASSLQISSDGTANYLYGTGAVPLTFATNGAERMRIDSSGNLGLGVTPSAWNTFRAAQVGAGAAVFGHQSTVSEAYLSANLYYNSGVKYIGSGPATYYGQSSGTHAWYTAPSGTAGNAISFTQAMTLDASGNLQIGNTSYAYRVAASRASDGIVGYFRRDGATVNPALTISCNETGNTVGFGTDYAGATSPAMTFATSTAERARITSGGVLLVNRQALQSGITDSCRLQVLGTSGDWVSAFENSSSTTPYGLTVSYSGASPNGTGSEFLYCADSTAARAEIRSNGGLANYQSNNVDLSDIRTKTDINPLASYWNKIAALEIVSYKYKDQTHDDLNIGVIAQQVEQVAPEFVDPDGFGETPEDGVPLKTIYNKDITFAAIKALQEAMARIEKLEAEVAALKGV